MQQSDNDYKLQLTLENAAGGIVTSLEIERLG